MTHAAVGGGKAFWLLVNAVLNRSSRGDPVQGQRPLPRVRLRAAGAHHTVHIQHRGQRAVVHLPADERAVPPRGPRAVAVRGPEE